jgi:tetratricopeptide (TPR) repeat protein
MKTPGLILFILIALMIMPAALPGQNKEVPITTSSKEALKYFMDGRDKFDNNEFVAAASLFDKAIQKDPNFATAYYYRALSGGGYNVFRQNLDKAISLIGSVSEGEKLEIEYLQANADGNGQKQKEFLDKLLVSFPSDKRIQAGAGTYFYFINDFTNALKHFTKAIELDKNYAAAYNMIGYCQSALNNYPESEKAFQTYIKLVPNRGNPYDSYGELLLKMGKYDESIVQYKKAVGIDPADFVSSLGGIGDNYIYKGDYETARKYYQDYYDKAPTTAGKLNAMYLKSVSYVHEGKIENAIKTFDEYRVLAEKENLDPNVINSYRNQCYIFAETGNTGEALKCYDKAIDITGESKLPESAKENLNTNLMMVHLYLLTSSGELEKASAELGKCKLKVESRKNPDEEMGLNSLIGLLESRKGNYDKAIEYFSKAGTDVPWVWYNTAVAYSKKGDKQNANKLYDKITKWNVNSLDLALVRNRAMDELKK